MDLLDRDSPSTDTFLQITRDGVGALNNNVAYTQNAIAASVPDTVASEALIGIETETRTAIVLSRKANGSQVQLLQVIGGADGKVAEIHGVSRHVVGPAGERPGMTLAQAGVDPTTCRAGVNLWLGLAICDSRGAANIKLTFSFTGDAATSDKLPPLDVLETGELQQIIWTPKR